MDSSRRARIADLQDCDVLVRIQAKAVHHVQRVVLSGANDEMLEQAANIDRRLHPGAVDHD